MEFLIAAIGGAFFFGGIILAGWAGLGLLQSRKRDLPDAGALTGLVLVIQSGLGGFQALIFVIGVLLAIIGGVLVF